MTWYYIKKGLTEDLTVGPIPTGEFLAEVREGKFKPQTLVVSQEDSVLANQQAKEQRVQQVLLEHDRFLNELQTAPRVIFEDYLMPRYIEGLWYAAVVISAVIAFGAFVGMAAGAATGNTLGAGIQVFGGLVALFMTAIGLCVVRLVLESFAVFFDIREMLRKQEMILRYQYTPHAKEAKP